MRWTDHKNSLHRELWCPFLSPASSALIPFLSCDVLQSITFPGLQSARAISFLEARDGESTTVPNRRATLPCNSSSWTDGDMKLPDINVREIGVRRTEDWNFLMESTRIQALRNYFRIAVQKLDLRGFLDNCKMCIRLGTFPRNSSRWTDGEFSMCDRPENRNFPLESSSFLFFTVLSRQVLQTCRTLFGTLSGTPATKTILRSWAACAGRATRSRKILNSLASQLESRFWTAVSFRFIDLGMVG